MECVDDNMGWCRHCGEDKQLTEEHIPPRATGNDGQGKLYVEKHGALDVLRDFQDGHSIRSLCEDCNNKGTTRGLVKAYTRWDEDVNAYLSRVASLFAHTRHPFSVPMDHGRGVDPGQRENLCPGSIARQVLGMMLAVQHKPYLMEDHPQLKDAYFSDAPTSIGPMSLHVALADAGLGYFTGPFGAVRVDLRTGRSTGPDISWAIALPPFLFVLSEGASAPITAARIEQWLAYPTKRQFSKADRRQFYPPGNLREMLVAKMYQDQQNISKSHAA